MSSYLPNISPPTASRTLFTLHSKNTVASPIYTNNSPQKLSMKHGFSSLRRRLKLPHRIRLLPLRSSPMPLSLSLHRHRVPKQPFPINQTLQPAFPLLESSGIDLKRNSQVGIHSTLLARLLLDAGLVGLYSTVTWVAFHGCCDFAILLNALFQLTNGMPVTLPETLEVFMTLTRCIFGDYIYDVKCIMRNCNGIYGGLERVAKKLKVEQMVGKAHQAGSDSLLICQVFLRMKKMFFSEGSDGEEEKMPSEGAIFGLNE